MDNISYAEAYEKYKIRFELYLHEVFRGHNQSESGLLDAMKYSLLAGGKRVRPVLLLAMADIFNGNQDEALPFALALECIHTYSLVHDDLPALDNDVLRRGKPTCHIKFGEAMAILAGDGLLNFAFEHALEHCSEKRHIDALRELSVLSGYKGMLGGQALDTSLNKDCNDPKTLFTIIDKKTSALLTAPLTICSILFAPEKLGVAREYGYNLGLLFQMVDDIADVVGYYKLGKSTGKDDRDNKFTSVSYFGLVSAKEKVKEIELKMENISKSLENSGFLNCFTHMITSLVI